MAQHALWSPSALPGEASECKAKGAAKRAAGMAASCGRGIEFPKARSKPWLCGKRKAAVRCSEDASTDHESASRRHGSGQRSGRRLLALHRTHALLADALQQL